MKAPAPLSRGDEKELARERVERFGTPLAIGVVEHWVASVATVYPISGYSGSTSLPSCGRGQCEGTQRRFYSGARVAGAGASECVSRWCRYEESDGASTSDVAMR